MTRPRVLFIGGVGRSGTTLLERVVGELPSVTALGEVMHLWARGAGSDERCGCGQSFSRCSFWQAVGDVAFDGWQRVDLDRLAQLKSRVNRARVVPRMIFSSLPASLLDDVLEYADHFVRLYGAAQEVSESGLLIDSSKQVSLAYCLSHHPGVDLRVVQCVRDSRGVAYSWTKEVRRPEVVDDIAYMPRYGPTSMSFTWNLHNMELAGLPIRKVPTMRLRYESFVENPRQIVRSLARFSGLDISESDLGFLGSDAVELTVAHTAAGNPMRFRTGRLELRRDEAWRQELPAAQRRIVTAMTLPLLVRYGYSPKTARSST